MIDVFIILIFSSVTQYPASTIQMTTFGIQTIPSNQQANSVYSPPPPYMSPIMVGATGLNQTPYPPIGGTQNDPCYPPLQDPPRYETLPKYEPMPVVDTGGAIRKF